MLASAIATLSYRYYAAQKEATEQQVRNQLLGVADFKVAGLSAWRQDRIDAAQVPFADPYAARSLERLTSGNAGQASLAEVRAQLEEMCRRLRFASATFTDNRGTPIVSAGRVFGNADHIRRVAGEVLQANQMVIRDLHMDETSETIHLGVNLPVRESPGAPLFGTLLLGIDPRDRLYPMLQQWPEPSKSGETLLVRRDNDELVYLNELRFRQNAALRLRTSIGGAGVPSAQIRQGVQGSVEGVDYRGVPVFAAVRAIPGTPWFLVAKVDAQEVLAPLRRRSIMLGGATVSLILLAGAALYLVWRRQQLQFYRARYEAEQERQALAGHYDYLSRFANDIVLLIDGTTGRIVEANDRAVAAYGFSRDEFLQMTVRDLRHPSSLPEYDRQWRDAGERGSLVFECVHRRRDGRPIPVEVSVRFIEVGDKQFRQSIIRDITERKTMDEKLRRSLDAFGAVIDSSPAAIISVTPEFAVTTWSKGAERLLGWTAEEVIGAAAPFVPREKLENARRIHDQVMDGQTILGIHALAQCKDERILNVSLSAAPLHDSEGKCAGVVLNLLDTTDRAQAEESLRRNEFLFRATFDQAAVGMNYTAVDGRYLRVNDRYCEITGYSRDELLQLRYQDITYPDDLARSDRNNQELLCEQMATTSETKRYIRKDGSVVWVQVMVSLLRSESGEPLHFVGVIDDVTERIRAQEALRHSEDRFRRVVESAPEGILVERDLQILYVNPAAMSLFGASSMTELEGRSLLDLISPQDRDTAEERSARVGMHMAVPPLERTYLRLDRSPLWVEVSAAPIQYDQQIASLVFLRDITQRKQTEAEKQRLEEQLLQAQKMESLGRLAGGVAHDFNNHLTVITGYCDMLLAQLEHGDEIREEIEEIRGAGEKAAALTQQLLAFSRKQIAERKPVNLNEPVAESRKMLCRLIGEQIEIVCEPDPELGLVSADRAQMNQVLLNLTINARDAMPSGGRITIRTANVELDREGAQKHKGVAPGRYVLLSVSDTGTGMSESTLQHVFEPFFTTKGVGVGTGLGLSTVYGIVRQSDGWIEVDSRLGEGSEFRVYLPRVAAATVNAAPAALPAVAPGGAETVLVVEDQAEVRRLAMRILKINGYNLLEAGSGPEALELCRSFTRPIELLVTDVIMPGMTGKELATRLLKLRPSMKVLYVSGYTADVMNREGVLDADVAFLPKPFTPAQLSVKVREVLGQAHAAGRILVIDDDDAVRGLLQQSLLDAGYEVQSAPDGGAGMRLMADHEFDLVVTDLIMPDQEGIETIRELRRNYPATRIVAVSGALDSVYLKTAEMLGADLAMRKPIDSQHMLRVIRDLLS